MQHFGESDGSMADRAHVQRRNAVLRRFAQRGRPDDQFARQNTQRSIPRHAQSRIAVFAVIRQFFIAPFGKFPVDGRHVAAVLTGQPHLRQVVRDIAETFRRFGMPRLPPVIEMFARFGQGFRRRASGKHFFIESHKQGAQSERRAFQKFASRNAFLIVHRISGL